MNRLYFTISLTLFNFIFPIIGGILSLFNYFIDNNKKYKVLLLFNILISLSFVGYLYIRTNQTGDWYKYMLTFNDYKSSLTSLIGHREFILENNYEKHYYVWYFLYFIFSKLNLNIHFLTMFIIFISYLIIFYVIFLLNKKLYITQNDLRVTLVKLFLISSPFILLSSYKTFFAFSFILLSICFFIEKKIFRGSVFAFLGIGIHPFALFPILIFIFSLFFRWKNTYLYLFLLIGFLGRYIFSAILVYLFSSNSFFYNKVLTYILGEWSKYNVHYRGELFQYILLFSLVFFWFLVIVFYYDKVEMKINSYLRRYLNFILWYFSFSILFIEFRTIELRLIVDGFIFFIPFLFIILQNRLIHTNNFIGMVLFLIFWFLLVDYRMFNIFNDAYKIGEGFPYNIFYSPFIEIFKGSI